MVTYTLSEVGFIEEFMQFVVNAGLAHFLTDKCDQYYLLTNSFIQNFNFINTLDAPTIRFNLYATTYELPLDRFCEICLLPSDGEVRDCKPEEFEAFLLTLTMGETRGVSNARSTSLHFPSLHYFSLFIGKCITAMEQGVGLSALTVAILRCAFYSDNNYKLGTIVARRLHLNQTRGMIHGGIYATCLAKNFEVAIHPIDYLLPQVYLDHQSMIEHHFTHATNIPLGIHYNFVYIKVTHDIIVLPASSLFNFHARNSTLR